MNTPANNPTTDRQLHSQHAVCDPETEIASIWHANQLLMVVARCVLMSCLLSAGLGGLTLLSKTERVSMGVNQRDDNAVATAQYIAVGSLAPTLLMALLIECQLLVVIHLGWRWTSCQIFFPVIAAILGGYIAWSMFVAQASDDPLTSLGEFFSWSVLHRSNQVPKDVMLVSGGALIAYLASALQLTFWGAAVAPVRCPPDHPVAWYFALVLIAATFLGALRGWQFMDPKLKALLEYRKEQWLAGNGVDALPAEPFETREVF